MFGRDGRPLEMEPQTSRWSVSAEVIVVMKFASHAAWTANASGLHDIGLAKH